MSHQQADGKVQDGIVPAKTLEQEALPAVSLSTDLAKLTEAVAKPPVALAPRRILLAEDNSVNRRVTAYMLRNLGYEVDAVCNGLEALNAFDRASYDIVILDCDTPEMDGYGAAREIRHRFKDAERHIPIIALTAGSRQSDRERRQAAGIDDYITTPVKLGTVQAVLSRWDTAANSAVAPPMAIDRNVFAGLKKLAGDRNPALVAELIEMFLGGTPQRIAELRQALRRKDVKALREIAHNLRGSSGQLGAMRMEQTCAAIEVIARADAVKGIRHLLDQLELDFDRARQDLQALAAEREMAVSSAPPSSPAAAPDDFDATRLRRVLQGKRLAAIHADPNRLTALKNALAQAGCRLEVRSHTALYDRQWLDQADLLVLSVLRSRAEVMDELAQLRKQGLAIPVIVLSDHPAALLRDYAHRLDADFILEPFRASELLLRATLLLNPALTKAPDSTVCSDELLIAEDDPLIGRFLVGSLNAAGFRTTLVADGEAALALLSQRSFAAVILDITMPKVDGFGVLSQLRLQSAKTPVLMLSARAQEHDVVKAFNLGADDYVTKPFNPLEVVSRIKRLARRQ